MNGSIFHTSLLVDVVQTASHKLDEAGKKIRICAEPFDIRSVKTAHLNWLGQLGNVVHGRSDLSDSEVNNGHQCAFGKWYDTEGSRLFGHSHLFKEVGRIHMELHEKGKNCVRQANSGQRDAAKQNVANMHSTAVELFNQLDELYLDQETSDVAC